jgi:hypothetical protein
MPISVTSTRLGNNYYIQTYSTLPTASPTIETDFLFLAVLRYSEKQSEQRVIPNHSKFPSDISFLQALALLKGNIGRLKQSAVKVLQLLVSHGPISVHLLWTCYNGAFMDFIFTSLISKLYFSIITLPYSAPRKLISILPLH